MHKFKRQHPAWIVYQVGKLVKSFAFPVFIIALFAFRYDNLFVYIVIGIALIILLYESISILLRWKNNTYYIDGQMIYLTEGRFISKERYIALDKIHNIREETTILHRLLGTSSLLLQTGTSTEDSSVKLEMIPLHEAKRIHTLMEQASYVQNEIPVDDHVTLHYQMSWKEVILISITSLYIVALFPIVLSIYFKLNDVFAIESYANIIGEVITQSWWIITLFFVFAAMIAIGGGILFTYIRFGNYEVSSDRKHIYIQKGMIRTSYFSIPRDKINGIIIEKSLTKRMFGMVKIKLINVHDNLLDNEVETDVLLPFIRAKRGQQLIAEMLPQYLMEEKMHTLPKQSYFVELIQPNFILVIIIFFIYFFWPEFWFVPIVYALYLIIKRILTTNQQRFIWKDDRTQIQTGNFSVAITITKRDKIDGLVIDQSWIERKLGLASIQISTRANPLHVTKAERIRVRDAMHFHDWYQY